MADTVVIIQEVVSVVDIIGDDPVTIVEVITPGPAGPVPTPAAISASSLLYALIFG